MIPNLFAGAWLGLAAGVAFIFVTGGRIPLSDRTAWQLAALGAVLGAALLP